MVRKALDNGKFACGIFIDHQKAFDTVDRQILLKEYQNIMELKDDQMIGLIPTSKVDNNLFQ